MAKKKEKGKGEGNSVTFAIEDPDEACERLTGIAPANETHTFRGIAQAKEKRLNNSGTLPAATRTDDRAGSSDSPSKGSSLSSIRSPSRTSNLSPVKSGTLQSKGGSGHLLMKDGKSGGSFISSQGKGGSKALVRAEGWEGESEESSDSEAPSSRGQPATPPSRVAVASRRNVGKRQPIHDSPEVEEARAKLKVLSVADFEVMASVEAPPPIFTLCFGAVRALMGLPVDVSWKETRRTLRDMTSQHGGAQELDHSIINSAKRWLTKGAGGLGGSSQESKDAKGMLELLREWRKNKEAPGQHSKDSDEMLGLLREEHKRRLEETGKPSAVYAQALSELSWMQKSNGEYPLPTQPQMKPKLARDMLDFDLSSIQPKAGIACVKKWVENPEFTAEKAGEHSLAARAMVEWVRAADVYFKERKSRPTGEQIERAIVNGSGKMTKCSNLALQRMLPEICRQTGKTIGHKTYQDLTVSKSRVMRMVFADGKEKRRRGGGRRGGAGGGRGGVSGGAVEGEPAVKDVDLRGSHEHFRKAMSSKINMAEETGELSHLGKSCEPRLLQLYKFEHRAFDPEVNGVRSWHRFDLTSEDTGGGGVGSRRPCTAERNIFTSEALDEIYRSDSLVRRLLKAIDANDAESIRKVVYAGAPLDWADDKGRTALDYAKEGKKQASVVALERIVADFQASLPNGRPPAVPRYRPQERRGAGKGGGVGKTGSAVAASLLPAIDEGGGKVGGRRVGGGGGGHRPMTQQVRRREKMVVRKNSRTQTIQPPKYALDDPLPDDYTTSSGESGDEQEELTAEERRRINIAKFMYLFNPPLTPLQPVVNLQDESIAGATDGVSLDEKATTPPESLCASPAGDASAKPPSPGTEEGGGNEVAPSSAGGGKQRDEGMPAAGVFEGVMLSAGDVQLFEARLKEVLERKRGLWSIYKSEGYKGGLQDLGIDTDRHEYLRECEALGIVPRSLAYGRMNPEVLNLSSFGCNGNVTKALAVALKGLRDCKTLDLSENHLGEDGLKAVASALEGNDTLTSLSLASCKIGHGSTETVAKLLSVNKALARLDISNNGLVDRTFVPILKAVYDSNTLRVLLAGRNQGGQETWGAIAELVRFGSSLRELDLSWMTMRKEGGLPIIGALGSNQGLKKVMLGWNGLGDECGEAVGEYLYSTSGGAGLETLDMSHNRLRERGAMCIALGCMLMPKSVDGGSVKCIDLSSNPIGDCGVRDCIRVMDGEGGIEFGLKGCSLTDRIVGGGGGEDDDEDGEGEGDGGGGESVAQEDFVWDSPYCDYCLDLETFRGQIVARQLSELASSEPLSSVTSWNNPTVDGRKITQPEGGGSWEPPHKGILEVSFTPWRQFAMTFAQIAPFGGTAWDLPMNGDDVPAFLATGSEVTAGLPTPSGDGKQDYSVRLVRFLRSAKFKAVHVSRFEDDDVGEEFDEFEMVSIGKGADSLPPALGSTVHVTGPKGEEGVVRVSSYELDEDGTSACLLLKGSDMDLLFFCEPGTEIALEVSVLVMPSLECGELLTGGAHYMFKTPIPLEKLAATDARIEAMCKLIPTLERGAEESMIPYLKAVSKVMKMTLEQAEKLVTVAFNDAKVAEAGLKELVGSRLVDDESLLRLMAGIEAKHDSKMKETVNQAIARKREQEEKARILLEREKQLFEAMDGAAGAGFGRSPSMGQEKKSANIGLNFRSLALAPKQGTYDGGGDFFDLFGGRIETICTGIDDPEQGQTSFQLTGSSIPPSRAPQTLKTKFLLPGFDIEYQVVTFPDAPGGLLVLDNVPTSVADSSESWSPRRERFHLSELAKEDARVVWSFEAVESAASRPILKRHTSIDMKQDSITIAPTGSSGPSRSSRRTKRTASSSTSRLASGGSDAASGREETNGQASLGPAASQAEPSREDSIVEETR